MSASTLDALKDAMVVPHDAVNLGPNSRYVYVVKDGKAADARRERCCTTTAPRTRSRASCSPGDTVITDGQLRVLPGKPVAIVKPANGRSQSAAADEHLRAPSSSGR